MSEHRSGRVWDQVRRALGRVAGRIVSHPLLPSPLQSSVREARTLGPDDVRPGLESGWQPKASIVLLGPPAAPPGGEGVDLASVATVIGADQALSAADAEVSGGMCRIEGSMVIAGGMEGAGAVIPGVHKGAVGFSAAVGRTSPVRYAAPAVTTLAIERFSLRGGRRRSGSAEFWILRSGRLREGLAEIARIPLLRDRLAEDGQVFDEARRTLSVGAGVPETDVILIGAYPQVPLGAVRKLALGPEGATLLVWLKPEALGPGRAGRVKAATVVLGRQRSTGKSLQAVLRD